VVVLAAAGCTPHPVGPARTAGAYEGKAVTTVEGALSAVGSVELLLEAVLDGSTFAGYVGTVVSEQEDAIDGLGSTFGSVQPPPGEASEALRAEVDTLLDDALGTVTDFRIAARRGDTHDGEALLTELRASAAALQGFVERHG
jgi:hypothetical protein